MTRSRRGWATGTCAAGAADLALISRKFANRVGLRLSSGADAKSPLVLAERAAGRVRNGGFGGPAGLAGYLGRHRIDRLIDWLAEPPP